MTRTPLPRTAALLAGLLLTGLPAAAFAQSETPAEHGTRGNTPEERVERQIAHLHAQLHITPAQQSQWNQFAQVMRDNARDMEQALQQRGAAFDTMNAAENLQSYAQIAQQHALDTQKLANAFQPLYASMSEQQKQTADAIFHARGDHPMHRKG